MDVRESLRFHLQYVCRRVFFVVEGCTSIAAARRPSLTITSPWQARLRVVLMQFRNENDTTQHTDCNTLRPSHG